MSVVWTIGLPLAVGVLIAAQVGRALGPVRGILAGLLLAAGLAGGWRWLSASDAPGAAPADWAAVASVPAESCAKCHAEHYDSWHRTYHRTMTRDAAPDTIKGDFDNAVYDYRGLKTWLTRDGDTFYMKTVDPNWAMRAARDGDQAGPPMYRKIRVDRTVGSHWVQEYMHRDDTGRYNRLPVLYHIAEKKWVHSSGAFLISESPDFWSNCRGSSWNDTCLYCHNTGPVKNPQFGRAGVVGYKTQVAELGISCEACHGPGGEHERLNHNPARRMALHEAGAADPSIVHPARLPVMRRDEICARCHGALVPKAEKWDRRTHRDPFIAGQELGHWNDFFWSEAQQRQLRHERAPEPPPLDGRFWGDGTPLTTALEYNGMARSACYQDGHGAMSCLSCHTGHPDEPTFMLKPAMSTNEACLQCHAEYRDRLSEHTRHAGGSAGSLCFNCHMPHQVFSLLTTHRSHRIQIPDVKDSVGTGKPNACNLCHLDKSLGWTRDQLARWPGRADKPPVTLTEDEERISSALLLLATGDARTRVIVAGAFANPAARAASGDDWFGPFLTRMLESERFPMVRSLAHRGLTAARGDAAAGYDYLARPEERAAQLRSLRRQFDSAPMAARPGLPLTAQGQPDDAVLRRLLGKRRDPDVTINE